MRIGAVPHTAVLAALLLSQMACMRRQPSLQRLRRRLQRSHSLGRACSSAALTRASPSTLVGRLSDLPPCMHVSGHCVTASTCVHARVTLVQFLK